jgi:hypothetical protein
MRNSILILAAALAFTACSDGDRPTAPRTSGQSQLGPSGQSPSFDVASNGNKPVPAPKFTVTTVNSATADFGMNLNNFGYPWQGTVTATCPVGTTVIGGGYKIGNSDPEQLAVLYNAADGANGWSVKVLFTGTYPSQQATIYVAATCLQ